MLPTNSNNDQSFYDFLNNCFMPKVENLRPGEVMIAPAGWSTGTGGHIMLFVLSRDATEKGKYSFALINTGDGLQYHANIVDENTTQVRKALLRHRRACLSLRSHLVLHPDQA